MIQIPDNVPASDLIKRVWSEGKHSVHFPKDWPIFRLAFSRPISYKPYSENNITELEFNCVEFRADIVRYYEAGVKVINIFGKYKDTEIWVDTFVVKMENERRSKIHRD